MCANRQQEILRSAAKLLRAGGRLVYSTCTFAPEENEGVIRSFLQEHPEFQPETVDAPWFTPGENGSFRMWPHKLLGEGHFAAVLKKSGDAAPEQPQCCVGEKLPGEWLDFAKQLQIHLPEGKAIFFGQSLYWVHPQLPELKGIRTERPGLELGTVRKGRFEPAHALALWLSRCSQMQELGDSAGLYLHGDVVPSQIKGWCLVTVGGFSVGWGKGDGNVLKNHYPKGLRR
jgi:NOL1/NOP2/fmu family ribosome biogenesis protein